MSMTLFSRSSALADGWTSPKQSMLSLWCVWISRASPRPIELLMIIARVDLFCGIVSVFPFVFFTLFSSAASFFVVTVLDYATLLVAVWGFVAEYGSFCGVDDVLIAPSEEGSVSCASRNLFRSSSLSAAASASLSFADAKWRCFL